MLIIDNFIPPDDKNKILARAEFDEEEATWRLKALAKGGSVEFCVLRIFVGARRDIKFDICHSIFYELTPEVVFGQIQQLHK